MEKLLQEYRNELKTTGKSHANPNMALKIFAEYLKNRGTDFQNVRLKDAEDFQVYLCTLENEEGKSRYTKRSVIGLTGCVGMFYVWLKRRNIVAVNPFNGIKRVRSNKELPKDIPKEDELDKLLAGLRNFGKGKNLIERRALYKAHVISELMYSTGMRMGEVEKLKPEDIDFLRNTIKIKDSKTKRERLVLLNEYASEVLEIYVNQMRRFVNFNKNGGDANLLFGSKQHLLAWFDAVMRKATGRRFTGHTLRHSVGFHLLRAGCDIRVIQEILGHEDLSSTQVYTKVDKEDLKSVIDEYHPRKLKRTKRNEAL